MLLLIEAEVSIQGGEDEETSDGISGEIPDRIMSMLSAARYSMDGY